MKSVDEFYIGWEPQAPPSTARTIRICIVGLAILAAALGVIISVSQRTIARSVFEWGKVKKFSGVFIKLPYPHIVSETNTFYLVAPFKHGVDPTLSAKLDGQNVVLQGTLIYRENQQMIEVTPQSIKPISFSTNTIPQTPLGRQTLVGEIVDSKCYFGVMNPGQFIPHRACAIRCISGGIPPVLVVRHANGETSCLLLTSKEGHSLNKQILRIIAEPVEVTGDVFRDGDLLTIRAEQIKRFRP